MCGGALEPAEAVPVSGVCVLIKSEGIRLRPSGKHLPVNTTTHLSGDQLHITSLPGGRLGPEAYKFIAWLAAAAQSWWQVLPLGPPDRYGSPYNASSAFAAWRGWLQSP